MGVKERKEREKDERRDLILNAATEIMKEEGLDNISIRKIASRIEYSPAIIYHYFQDKDEIINQLMKKGYQKIIDGLSSGQTSTGGPKQLEKLMRNYINVALQMPDEFKTVQLNSSPGVLEHTSYLFKGASGERAALGILFQCLKDVYKGENIDEISIELTAQVIAATTFGLIIRLILEKDIISDAQREKLIEHYIKCTIDGLGLSN